jgi:hypothetical protein
VTEDDGAALAVRQTSYGIEQRFIGQDGFADLSTDAADPLEGPDARRRTAGATSGTG